MARAAVARSGPRSMCAARIAKLALAFSAPVSGSASRAAVRTPAGVLASASAVVRMG